MRITLLLAILTLCLAGCSLFKGSPSDTVKKFISFSEKGDVDGMTSLFSSKTLQKKAKDQISSNDKRFSELNQKAIAAGENPQMEDIKESVSGDTAKVSFFYRDMKKNDSMALVFKLSKENNEWKIDDIGGPEMDDTSNTSSSKSGQISDANTEPISALELYNYYSANEAAANQQYLGKKIVVKGTISRISTSLYGKTVIGFDLGTGVKVNGGCCAVISCNFPEGNELPLNRFKEGQQVTVKGENKEGLRTAQILLENCSVQ